MSPVLCVDLEQVTPSLAVCFLICKTEIAPNPSAGPQGAGSELIRTGHSAHGLRTAASVLPGLPTPIASWRPLKIPQETQFFKVTSGSSADIVI